MASQGEAITINGGEVYAYGISGAGIGGGGTDDGNNNGYDGADVIITDGMVLAVSQTGAGIGGGNDGNGGTVTINGGTVVATAGKSSARSIGAGDGGDSSGSLILYDNAQVTYGHLDSEGDVVEEGAAYGPDAAAFCRNKQFSAVTPGPCSVTFDAGGHGTAPQPQTVEAGETVKKPADPAAEGYYFAGWFTDESRQIPYDFRTPVNTLTLTLYGK